MERNSGAYTHTQEGVGHSSQSKTSPGQEHTDSRPTGATTNESDPGRRDPMHGSVTQEQSTNIVEAEGLKRLRREEGTADRR